ALAHAEYHAILQRCQIGFRADQALHEIIQLCRRHQIGIALFLMPEGSEFRSWYPPAVQSRIDQYLAHLGEECSVPVLDMRTWMADVDFVDSHHLLPKGAAVFTKRFEGEVLRPLLRGDPWATQLTCQLTRLR